VMCNYSKGADARFMEHLAEMPYEAFALDACAIMKGASLHCVGTAARMANQGLASCLRLLLWHHELDAATEQRLAATAELHLPAAA